MVPLLRQGNYSAAIQLGVDRTAALISADRRVGYGDASEQSANGHGFRNQFSRQEHARVELGGFHRHKIDYNKIFGDLDKGSNGIIGSVSTAADAINSRFIILFAGASQEQIAKRTSSSCAAAVTARST